MMIRAGEWSLLTWNDECWEKDIPAMWDEVDDWGWVRIWPARDGGVVLVIPGWYFTPEKSTELILCRTIDAAKTVHALMGYPG